MWIMIKWLTLKFRLICNLNIIYIITNILKKFLFIFICSFWKMSRDYKYLFQTYYAWKLNSRWFELNRCKILQNLSFYFRCSSNIEISWPFRSLMFLLQRTKGRMHLAGWIRARSIFPSYGRCSWEIFCSRNARSGRRWRYVWSNFNILY